MTDTKRTGLVSLGKPTGCKLELMEVGYSPYCSWFRPTTVANANLLLPMTTPTFFFNTTRLDE